MLLQIVPERHSSFAFRADDRRLRCLASQTFEQRGRPRSHRVFFQPRVEPFHRHLAVADGRAAVGADVVAKPHHLASFLQRVFVDVFAEDDLLLHRNRRIEIDLQFARTFRPAGQLHTQLLPGESLEVGGVTPELILLEGPRVMQPHHQRSVEDRLLEFFAMSSSQPSLVLAPVSRKSR